MGRWQPDAPGRLQQAALELFAERGFEATTVSLIAERAGLTERTFFRHYPDKREVLFAGSHQLEEFLVSRVGNAPPDMPPLVALAAALDAAAPALQERRAFSRQRHAVLAANPSLQERELTKLASLSSALATILRDRGADELAAALAAEMGVAAFKVGFERWITATGSDTLANHLRAAFTELPNVVSVALNPR